jgi:hypothetical protein
MSAVHEHCDACGFDGSEFDDLSLLTSLHDLGSTWRALIGRTGEDLRVRPSPDVWSAIEYVAHSRDITALHVFGVEQALSVDEPLFPAIEGDELIESAATSYGDADPDVVVDELETEAMRLAGLAQDAGADAWSRGLTIGESRTDVRRLLEHALHDSLHHVDDVERGLTLLRARRSHPPPMVAAATSGRAGSCGDDDHRPTCHRHPRS